MSANDRAFKGIWIPAEVYEAPGVCWTAKILFLEIDSFTKRGNECFMSNARLSKFLGVSETQVSKHISRLIEMGWIRQTSFDGRKRYLESCLEVNFNPGLNHTSKQLLNEVQGSSKANFNHTNTINNTITNSNKSNAPAKEHLASASEFNSEIASFSKGKKNEEERVCPAPIQEEADPAKFIEAFNRIGNRKFRVNKQVTEALLARLKTYTKAEIFRAIKNAHKDSYHIETNFKHLTPEFILREDKLEKFLNANIVLRSNEVEGFTLGARHNANG